MKSYSTALREILDEGLKMTEANPQASIQEHMNEWGKKLDPLIEQIEKDPLTALVLGKILARFRNDVSPTIFSLLSMRITELALGSYKAGVIVGQRMGQ